MDVLDDTAFLNKNKGFKHIEVGIAPKIKHIMPIIISFVPRR